MKRKISNNKGITLIALIITIIILLILAAVSIKIAFSGGLIDKAKSAVGLYNQKEKEQNEILQGYINDIDKLSPVEIEKPTEEEKNKFQPLVKEADVKMIAGHGIRSLSDFDSDALGILYLSGDCLIIMDAKADKGYIYTTSDETAKIFNIEAKYWHEADKLTDSEFKKYTGPNPIQVSDFPDSEIYSKSYLEKIIKSFGTEPDTNKLGKLTVITDAEMAQCKVDQGTHWVAMKNNTDEQTSFGIIVEKEESQFFVAIVDFKNKKVYEYSNLRKSPIENSNKFNIWTVGTMATESEFENFEEYTGPSPIQASDFASSEIYCSSYLNKIIASFNN